MSPILVLFLVFIVFPLVIVLGTLVSVGYVLLQTWLMGLPEQLHRWRLRHRLPRLARRLSLSAEGQGAGGTMLGERRSCAIELAVRDAGLRAESGLGPGSFSAQYLLTVRANSAVTEMPRRWLALQSAAPKDLGAGGPFAVRKLLTTSESTASAPAAEPDTEEEMPGLMTRNDGLSCWIPPRQIRGAREKVLSARLESMIDFIHLLEDDTFIERLEAGSIRSHEGWMRRWGLRTLLRLGPTTEAAARVCQALSRDPDPYVRLDALKALGECGVEGLEAMTMASTGIETDEVRAEALRRWLSSPRPPGNHALLDLIADRTIVKTVVVAAQALATSEDPNVELPLLALLHERRNVDVKGASIDALARIGGPRSAQALAAVAEEADASENLRRRAADALLRIRSRLAGQWAGRLSVTTTDIESEGQLSEPIGIGALSDPTRGTGSTSQSARDESITG
ncbi:MAG: HEAT repeat domain-containing protein [Deltaproteobacteria bacterium]|nr:HEAT repeat domain-containing protein [Deltaproteobacteria bacterium]